MTVGELQPLTQPIRLVEYDPEWPERFATEADRIRAALGDRALRIEHIGSTAVPGLSAKPIIDIILVVSDSADESAYVPALEQVGFTLRIREPDRQQHRTLRKRQPAVNLHVFSTGASEIERHLVFRDWLRRDDHDRALYERTKQELVRREWRYTQDYADAKTAIIAEITARARASVAPPAPEGPA